MKLVNADNTRLARSGEGHLTASRRWLGRRAEGPGADALGKDFTPFRMTASESRRGWSWVWRHRRGWGLGVFDQYLL